jgi:Amt family ammonium transporter
LIGFLGGGVFILAEKLVVYCKVDDPVDAVPIHGGCGILGATIPGWFDRDSGLLYGFGGR